MQKKLVCVLIILIFVVLMAVPVLAHPLDDYMDSLKKNVTAYSYDFILDEEIGKAKVEDGSFHTLGGMITSKTIKTTRTNSIMAFITLEDMFGTVEVIVFPRDFDRYKHILDIDAKVFIRGRVTTEEDKDAKLICQEIIPFNELPKEIWLRFRTHSDYKKSELELYSTLDGYDGNDSVIIYCEAEKIMTRLPKSKNVSAKDELITKLKEVFTENNVRIVEKQLDSVAKIN